MSNPNLHLHLRDRNPAMVAAWRQTFAGVDGMTISHGDIFADDVRADAIVSPANSFGFMDGGIDLAYVERFGWELQHRLRRLLAEEHDGELPVGLAVIVPTNDFRIPLMIAAPTMRVPSDVSGTLNAYLAFRAALRAADAHNRAAREPSIRTVLCPGMATTTGRMPHAIAARQMLAAYRLICQRCVGMQDRAGKILHNHSAMLRGEPLITE